MWRTIFYIFPTLLFVTIISIFSSSCKSHNEEKDDTDTVVKPVAKAFSVANYNFAILQDKKFVPYNKAIYHRGDEVFLVLQNVGPFKLGRDSMNKAEMKLVVTDAIGQKVIYKDSLLQEKGHKRFLNNTLASPYGSFKSVPNDKPGKYTICVTMYDLIKRDSVVVCDDFFIE